MPTLQQDLQQLYKRDLDRLAKNLENIPEDKLWEIPDGVTNSCGVLVQHIVGNLHHFIGNGMGSTGYVRQRDEEFANTGKSKKELLDQIDGLQEMLDEVFANIDNEQLTNKFPLDIPFDGTARSFLLHLYGHLNYHLGQMNYLRRMFLGED